MKKQSDKIILYQAQNGAVEVRLNEKQQTIMLTKKKSTPMLGFLGTFSVNFEIPDYWGIGKSVSRGFGTVKRCR